MRSESSCATASPRTPVRCPGSSKPTAGSMSSAPLCSGASRIDSRELFVSPTTSVPAAAHHAIDNAFALQRCTGKAASSSAALGPSTVACSASCAGASSASPSASSSSLSADPIADSAFFSCFACARRFRLFSLFFTSVSPWQRNISTVLPEPWQSRTSNSTPLGLTNCNPSKLPCPSGLGTAPRNVTCASPSAPDAPGDKAQMRKNLSAAPAASRVCAAFRASDHTSTLHSASVCRQSCSSTDQTRTKRSFEALMRRAGPGPAPAPGGPSQKRTAVTWSTWPRSRATPLSETMSQTTMSVSLAPEATRCPSPLKARQEMPDLWPCSVCSTAACS
mmetsp:Transcript_32941/g.94446  ORF Transcript_32941/g.94446 Transcript_32941/m.94446 type:complete len:335 (+) Transcript_32941:963-1967(+)